MQHLQIVVNMAVLWLEWCLQDRVNEISYAIYNHNNIATSATVVV